jgi:hypothetical protein
MSRISKHTFPLLTRIGTEVSKERPVESTSALMRSYSRWLACHSIMSKTWHQDLGIVIHNQISPCFLIILERFQIPDRKLFPLLDTILEFTIKMYVAIFLPAHQGHTHKSSMEGARCSLPHCQEVAYAYFFF